MYKLLINKLRGTNLMNDSYVFKMHKKWRRGRFLGVAIFSLTLLMLIGYGVYEYNDKKDNPFIINTLSDYYNAKSNDYYVKIESSEIYDMNFAMFNSKDNSTFDNVTDYFLGIRIEDKILPVSVPKEDIEKVINGEISYYVVSGNIRAFEPDTLRTLKNVLVEDGLTYEEVNSIILPNYLEHAYPVESLYMFIGLAVIFIFIFSILYGRIFIINRRAKKSLLNYFNGNLENAYSSIDMDIYSSETFTIKPFTLTQNYIIVDSKHVVLTLPLKEMMWVYVHRVTYRIFFFVKINVSTSLELVFSDNRKYRIAVPGFASKGVERANGIIDAISHRTPVFVGYSDELRALFKKKPEEFKYQWELLKQQSYNTEVTEF